MRGGGFVVGTESQLMVGMRVGRDPGSDAQWLAPLRAQARRYLVCVVGFEGGRRSDWVSSQQSNTLKFRGTFVS